VANTNPNEESWRTTTRKRLLLELDQENIESLEPSKPTEKKSYRAVRAPKKDQTYQVPEKYKLSLNKNKKRLLVYRNLSFGFSRLYHKRLNLAITVKCVPVN